MNKNDVKKLVEELIAVPHCCPELKEAGRTWMEALGTPAEHGAAEALLAELKEDVIPIDGALAFFASPHAAEHFGEERAAQMAAHMRALKDSGAVYCDCPACAKGAEIMAASDVLLS